MNLRIYIVAALLSLMVMVGCVQNDTLVAEPNDTVNLPEALLNDSRGMVQRWMNGWGLPHFFNSTGSAPKPSYEWPDATTVVYNYPTQIAGQQYLKMTLSGIHVTDYGEIHWGDEAVGKRDEISNVITTVQIEQGEKYSHTFDWHFKAVETIEDSTTTGFEASAKASLGPSYAKFDFEGKVKREATKAFGSEQTYAEDDSQTISFEGPRHVRIEAVRDREQKQRHASSQPIVEYEVCIETRYEAVFTVCWGSKAELISYMLGKEPDNVGVIQISSTGVSPASSEATAGIFRNRPYPNYTVPDNIPALSWPTSYVTILNQEIRAVDVTTGAIIEHD